MGTLRKDVKYRNLSGGKKMKKICIQMVVVLCILANSASAVVPFYPSRIARYIEINWGN